LPGSSGTFFPRKLLKLSEPLGRRFRVFGEAVRLQFHHRFLEFNYVNGELSSTPNVPAGMVVEWSPDAAAMLHASSRAGMLDLPVAVGCDRVILI
jgi:hypothetical protein